MDKETLLHLRNTAVQKAFDELDFNDKGQIVIAWDVENKLIPDRCDINVSPDENSCKNAVKCLFKFISENEDACAASFYKTVDEDALQAEYKSRVLHIRSVVAYLRNYDFNIYMSNDDVKAIVEKEYKLSEYRRDKSDSDVSDARLTADELISEVLYIAKYIYDKMSCVEAVET